MSRSDVAAAYDARAEEYIELLGSVEQMAEADRATIEDWGRTVDGLVLDAGCGPGHWTDVLSRRGPVLGLDASPALLASAREQFPRVPFVQGDLAALPLESGSVGGVLAWFSLIHARPEELDAQLAELGRVLVPGGSLLLGFFDGEPGVPFDHAVTTAYWWSVQALTARLAEHGLAVERSDSREGVKRREGHLIARMPPA